MLLRVSRPCRSATAATSFAPCCRPSCLHAFPVLRPEIAAIVILITKRSTHGVGMMRRRRLRLLESIPIYLAALLLLLLLGPSAAAALLPLVEIGIASFERVLISTAATAIAAAPNTPDVPSCRCVARILSICVWIGAYASAARRELRIGVWVGAGSRAGARGGVQVQLLDARSLRFRVHVIDCGRVSGTVDGL